MIYRFSDLQLDVDRRELTRDGESIHLTNLNFLVLNALLQSAPALLSHDELIDKAWGDNRVITPENLTQRIKVLRETLGDDADQPLYIEAVRGQGFRLIPEVVILDLGTQGSEKATPASRRLHWFAPAIALILVATLAWFFVERSIETGSEAPGAENTRDWPSIDLQQGLAVAVLPFVNMSDDPGNEFFGDGISEEIINTLVRQTSLPVVARTSSFQFKDQQVDGKEIGRKLGATHLLEGSVRKANQHVRITAQLIDVPSGMHLWSQQYDRSIEDLFEIQTEIAANITQEIQHQLEAQGETRISDIFETRTAALQGRMGAAAYEAFLKGMQHRNRLIPNDVALAREYFEEAVELSPDSESAWQALILTEFLASNFHMSLITPVEAYNRIEGWLETALPMFPDNIYMQIMHGWTLAFNQYRWKEGLDVLDQSLTRASGDAMALLLLGGAYAILAEQELATELFEQSHRLDPGSPHQLYSLPLLYIQAGRQDEAVALQFPAGYEYFNAVSIAAMNIFLQRSGEIDRAIREAKKYVPDDHPVIRTLESQMLNVREEQEAALAIEHELIDNMREVPITVGWVAPVRPEALAIAEEQRQVNPLQWIMLAYGQGWTLSDRLKPFPEKMKLNEMPERDRGRGLVLTETEKVNILNRGIEIPVSVLHSYVGKFLSGDDRLEIYLQEGQLHYSTEFRVGQLSAVSENSFISVTERGFSVEILANETGEYDLSIWRDGQWVHYGYREVSESQ